MNMAELCRNVEFQKADIWNFANGIASAVERMVLLADPNFEKHETNDAENLIIHDRLIPNPFSLKTVNNFNSPLTGHLKIIAYSVMVM